MMEVSQQCKQKILAYEIKTIQECPDSLFTDQGCQHERYLRWELGRPLKSILKDYSYKYRWIGNDSQAYIYSYFYVLVVGCASDSSSMLRLKLVLYELSKKYLAQFQQKLLIEFLCLIEYSTDRYLFFRKYTKIQKILCKLFKQIEVRTPLPLRPQFNLQDSADHQQGTFNERSTYITSVYKPTKEEQEKSTAIYRNSDYCNSIKKLAKQYQNILANKHHKKQSTSNQMLFLQWYRVYRQYFNFQKIIFQNQNSARFQMQFDQTAPHNQEFIITVEKGCFFVIEMKKKNIYKGKESSQANSIKSKATSNLDQSQAYIKSLLKKQLAKTVLLSGNKPLYKKAGKNSKNDSLSATPKFILEKQGIRISNKDFYKESSGEQVKKVKVQVLQISHFDEPKENEAGKNELQNIFKQSSNKAAYQGSKTAKTVEQKQESIVNKIKTHPLFSEVAKEQKAIKSDERVGVRGLGQGKQKNPEQLRCSIEDIQKQNELSKVNSIMSKTYRKAFLQQNKKDKIELSRGNQQIQQLLLQRKTSPANEKMLSAKMLHKNYKPKYNLSSRPFYSVSPPGRERAQFYSPSSTPEQLIQSRPSSKNLINKVKFTQD